MKAIPPLHHESEVQVGRHVSRDMRHVLPEMARAGADLISLYEQTIQSAADYGCPDDSPIPGHMGPARVVFEYDGYTVKMAVDAGPYPEHVTYCPAGQAVHLQPRESE